MKTLILIAAMMLGATLHSCYESFGITECSRAGKPQFKINGEWTCAKR